MILIRWSGSGARRRCYAHCYDATTARCDCICAGRNHGVGLDQARRNTAEWATTELPALAAQGDLIARAIVYFGETGAMPA